VVGNVFFDVFDVDFMIVIFFGVVGFDSVLFGGNGMFVDSFDFVVGLYGFVNKGSDVMLFSNGLIGFGYVNVFGDVIFVFLLVNFDMVVVLGNVIVGMVIVGNGIVGGMIMVNLLLLLFVVLVVVVCLFYSSVVGIGGKFMYSFVIGDLMVSGGKMVILVVGMYCFYNVIVLGGVVFIVVGLVMIVFCGVFEVGGGSFVN